MKKLLLSAVAAIALTTAANAVVVQNLGVNPNSSTGDFDAPLTSASGPFVDDYTFQLIGAPSFFTFASATQVLAQPSDFITSFTGQLFNDDTDTAVNAAVQAVGCPGGLSFCQVLAGQAILDPGNYFLRLTGIGGGTSGYGGNLTVAAVPIPAMGAGIIPLLAAGAWLARRRKKLAGQDNCSPVAA